MNDNGGKTVGEDYTVDEIARAWFTKMRGEEASGLRGEFEEWLSASPENKRAYDQVADLFEQSEILKRSERFGAGRTQKRSHLSSHHWLSIGAAAAAAAIVVLALNAGGASLLPGSLQSDPLAAHAAEPLVTRRGEIRSFQLADGSTATLDTDSRVEVSITTSERYVQLARGRVRLHVVADPRPFRVDAGAGVLTTHEAEFDVHYSERRQVMVQLISGQADIRSNTKEASTRPLSAGDSMTYRADDSRLRMIAQPLQPSSREWPSGWTEHRSIRLDELVAEANRYSTTPILLDGETTAQLEASGRFKISDTDMFVRRIAELFDLTVSRRADGIHLGRR